MKNKNKAGAGEMAQWLRAPAAVPEGFPPLTTICNFQFQLLLRLLLASEDVALV